MSVSGTGYLYVNGNPSFSREYDVEVERPSSKNIVQKRKDHRIVPQLKESFSSPSQHLEHFHQMATLACSVPRFLVKTSTGILTCFPSATLEELDLP